jgi:hypothetical protein
MQGLGYPASRAMLLPRAPELFEPMLKRTTLKQENEQ